LHLAFPHDEDLPSQTPEFRDGPLIPRDVGVKLRQPESFSCLGRGCPMTPFMTMPEAAVNDNDLLESREDKIRGAGEIAAMKAKSKAECVGEPSNQ
jgi:hypothetical protein